MSRKKKKMFLDRKITQQDIDDAVDMKAIIEDAFINVYPLVDFEMLLLWWLSSEPAEA